MFFVLFIFINHVFRHRPLLSPKCSHQPRCFLALAGKQLRLRSRLEAQRVVSLERAFAGWRVGLGRLLRARLVPIAGGEERRGSQTKGVGREDWGDAGGVGGSEAVVSARRGDVGLRGTTAIEVGGAGEEEEGGGGGGVSCVSGDLAKSNSSSSSNRIIVAGVSGLEQGLMAPPQDEEGGVSAVAGVWVACEAQGVERRDVCAAARTPPALLPSAFFVSGVASSPRAMAPITPLRRAAKEG